MAPYVIKNYKNNLLQDKSNKIVSLYILKITKTTGAELICRMGQINPGLLNQNYFSKSRLEVAHLPP